MTRCISETLAIRDTPQGDRICCRSCDHALGAAGQPWKPSSLVHEVPTDEAIGEETGAATILRLFMCPRCLAVLDSETAVPGEPFLEDVVSV
jgi:acetone carboxylase gamma subunit